MFSTTSCTSLRGAALAIVLATGVVAVVAPASASAQRPGTAAREDQLRAAARERYLRGRDLLGRDDAVGALQEFAASYEVFPTWAALWGMAMSQDAMDRPAEALRLYQRVLQEGGEAVPASERVSIGQRIAELQQRLGQTVVAAPTGRLAVRTTPAGARIAVGGEHAGTAPLTVDLSPGPHRVEAILEGHVSQVRWIDATAGAETVVEFTLEPSVDRPPGAGFLVVRSDAPGEVWVDGTRIGATPLPATEVAAGTRDVRVEAGDGRAWSGPVEFHAGRTVSLDVRLGSEGLSPAWFWTAAALAGACAVGGAAIGGYVLSLESKYYDDATSPAERDDIKSTGDPLRIVTDALFGAALGLAAGAATLFFFTEFSGGGPEADISTLPPEVAPAVLLQGAF